MPDLPDDREYHSQSGLTLCGGLDTDAIRRSCLTFTQGTWRTSHNLVHQRDGHTSWQSYRGIILMGGNYSDDTAELLTDSGDSVEIFTLKHPS